MTVQMKLVDMLARQGCDVNQVNKDRMTAVMIAAQKGYDDIIQTLLLAGMCNTISYLIYICYW